MKNEIGVIVGLRAEGDLFGEVKRFGLGVCQLVGWKPELWTDETADRVRLQAGASGVRVTGFWAGWPGPQAWNFVEGPATLGLVPAAYRAERIAALQRAGAFARRAAIPAVITHLGFVPENPTDLLFAEVVAAVRQVAMHLEGLGLAFWLETGQETPTTLLRLIQAVGTENLGVNLDPANLVMYGKGNPMDALGVFGEYVRNIHAKDGLYPTDPMRLGREVKVGEGAVRYPEFVRLLAGIGFEGEFIIEREITGEQQRRDIDDTVAYLKRLLAETP